MSSPTKSLRWLEERDPDRPFFLMCHHKAPHRPWDPKPEHWSLYTDPIPRPETFDDDYTDRAAAREARMRIVRDMTHEDLDLVQLPEAPGERQGNAGKKKVPHPADTEGFTLRCVNTGEVFTFDSPEELANFKYQRYLRKYLQCVHSVDENVGRILDWLDANGLAGNTLVIYTSDQGFYLGEHGWFDKRFIYWYNDDLGEKGARPGGAPPEWELFDLGKDPNELRNVYHDTEYAEVVSEMTVKLDAKMAGIGDAPMHLDRRKWRSLDQR